MMQISEPQGINIVSREARREISKRKHGQKNIAKVVKSFDTKSLGFAIFDWLMPVTDNE